MPAYDFRCTECDTTFEIVRSLSDDSEVRCPECGSACKRVFTPLPVVFKGSGFHNTDYRSKSSSSPAKTESACPSADSGSGSCSNCPAAVGE